MCKKKEGEFEAWVRAGSPLDRNKSVPSFVKHYYLLLAIDHLQATAFVETGTKHGETSGYIAQFVKTVDTVEAYQPCFDIAKQRLRKHKNVRLHFGDSSVLLHGIATKLKAVSTLFWLDAHYSGPGTALLGKPTPVLDELSIIASAGLSRVGVLIDDARGFGQWEGYPSIANVTEFCVVNFPNHTVSVIADQIRILPA